MNLRLWTALSLTLLMSDLPRDESTARTKTRSFKDVTGEVRDLRDPLVPDAKVKSYIDKLVFPDRGKGMTGSRKNVKSCHDCGSDSAPLEIVAEMGAIELEPGDLPGRIVALIRKDDWLPFTVQKDLGMRWRGAKAYLWIAAGSPSAFVYPAALISIDSRGQRKLQVKGTVRYRAFTPADPSTFSPGAAHWGYHEHKDGQVRKYDFHLGTWFACLQGCCQFTEDPDP
jgi:hypothetical protein